MAMNTCKIQVLMLQNVAGHPHGLAVLDAEAELGIVLAGGDKFVGICVDAGLDPEQYALMDTAGSTDGFQTVDLLKGIDDDGANAAVHSHFQFGDRLVVSVEMQMLGIKACLQGSIQLASGNHVGMDPLRSENGIKEPGAQGLAGVGDFVLFAKVALHRLGKIAAVFAQLALTHDISRRAVLLCHVHQIDTVHAQVAIVCNGEVLAVVGFHINSPLLRFGYLLLIDHSWFLFPLRTGSAHPLRPASASPGYRQDWARPHFF